MAANNRRASHLSRLVYPKPIDDLRLILPTEINEKRTRISGRTCYHRYEGYDECLARDAKNLNKVKSALKVVKNKVQLRRLRRLIETLSYDPDGFPPESRACAAYMYHLRLKITGELLRLRRTLYPDMAGVHLISAKWEMLLESLSPEAILAIIKELRCYLDSNAFRNARGFFVAGLDYETRALDSRVRPHAHCCATGDYPAIIDDFLRDRRAFCPWRQGKKPIEIGAIKQPGAALSYINKTHPTYRTVHPNVTAGLKDGIKTNRMPEPEGSLWLSVINELGVGDTLIMKGLYIQDGRLNVRKI